MKSLLLLSLFFPWISISTADSLPKEVHLVIEGSDSKESTFIVMEYKEEVGIRYLECDKPEGKVSELFSETKLVEALQNCKELTSKPLSPEEMRSIRDRANDGSLFERYLGKEKKVRLRCTYRYTDRINLVYFKWDLS